MVFGLSEESGEGEQQLSATVKDLFEEIGEKPRIDAMRIGKPSNESARMRPVKVTVSSSIVVQQILAKAKHLAQSPKYSKVFISPDRSPIQRVEHRLLVQALKDKRNSDSSKRYYLKNGKICSSDNAT